MVTIEELKARKHGKPIAMLTAYDAPFARIAEAAGIDMILVGDSCANVVLGYSSTREVGMDEMLLFVGAVRRGAPNTHIVADMPWKSERTVDEALANARRFMESGANSVKIEGARTEIIAALKKNNIPVVGHLGLLPQSATSFKQQGQSPEEAQRILQEARDVASAGVCCLVLEHIPESLGALISQALHDVPTIGIGAGREVNGQVLVLHDALGLHPFKIPPFAQKFSDLYSEAVLGMQKYVESVQRIK